MIELTLPAMNCGHFVKTVHRQQKVEPAASVQIDLPTYQARIESARPAEEFRLALTEEGHAPA